MKVLRYSFKVSGDSVNTARDFIDLVRLGVNLADKTLLVYTDTDYLDDGSKLLKFEVDTDCDPFAKCIRRDFLKELVYKFKRDKADFECFVEIVEKG